VAQRLHVVRGITLSSEDLAVEHWIAEVAEALAQLAAQNALAHAALSRFLIQ
jgi:hypothetical protein